MKYPTAATLVLMLTLASPALAATARDIAIAGTSNGAPPCSACHGKNGEGQPAAGFPRLAGLNAAYMTHQLTSFVDGTRTNPVMGPIAKALNDAQRTAVSDYYAGLTIPDTKAGSTAATPAIEAGALLANRGAWSKGVPACTDCHGPLGSGVGAAFPRLAGQSALYTSNQFAAWRSGTRHNDPMGLMGQIAKRLDTNEVADVAAYYAAEPDMSGTQRVEAAEKPAPHAAVAGPAAPAGAFTPPPEAAIPDNDFGKMVRLGENIFYNTQDYAGQYIGNNLQCSNCHLDRGRLAGSAPLWAAYVAYPAYRSKNKHVNTYAERLQECFRYSMNGKPPADDSTILVALEAYSYFLARGAAVGADMPGRGYPGLEKPTHPFDYARGEKVYAENCALCHGADGQGQSSAAGKPAFPPVWGAHSYNWGAGMADIRNAAAFIEANMPLSQGNKLSQQDAWDVAAFVDGHERPQDPRFTGSVAETRTKYHDSPMSMYGREVNGIMLGEHSPPAGPR
ncbi:MAG: c-type cytochrome [Xanthobacteraceae bacterium]|jgi:thiosulfate dehydrogenase